MGQPKNREHVARVLNHPLYAVVCFLCVLLVFGSFGTWFAKSGLAPQKLEIDYLAIASERVPSAMILANPDNMTLFLAYVDQMAEGVGNLELSPEWLLLSFVEIHNVSEKYDITIDQFKHGDRRNILISCESGSYEEALTFTEELNASNYFTATELLDWQEDGEFVASCAF